MSDTHWDLKLKAFFKKAGDDFKRAGADVKVEAERLLAEAKDPERAKKIKEGLAEMGVWAKKTSEELARFVETGVKKAEVVIKEAVAQPGKGASGGAPAPRPSASKAKRQAVPDESFPNAAPPVAAAPKPSAPSKKTVGRGGSKGGGAGKKTGAKKPLGRSKS